MGRLAGLFDDLKYLGRRQVVDRQPVVPLPARPAVGVVSPPGLAPSPRRALLSPHPHGADDPPAETRMRLQLTAQLALDGRSLEIRGAPPRGIRGPQAPLLGAFEQRLARGDGGEVQRHTRRNRSLDVLNSAGPLDLAERRVDHDKLLAGHDSRELDRHGLAVLTAEGTDRDECAALDKITALGGEKEPRSGAGPARPSSERHRSKPAARGQRDDVAVGDDEVVEQPHVDERQGLGELCRDGAVGLRGFGDLAGVIVKNHHGGVFLQRALHDHARVYGRSVHRVLEQLVHLDEAVARVEIQDAEHLVARPGEFETQESLDVVGEVKARPGRQRRDSTESASATTADFSDLDSEAGVRESKRLAAAFDAGMAEGLLNGGRWNRKDPSRTQGRVDAHRARGFTPSGRTPALGGACAGRGVPDRIRSGNPRSKG